MSISKNTQDREKQKFVESTVTAGKPVVAVSNSDGTPIGGGTGASANQVQGTAADNAASVGNPVLVGGYYESGTDTYADGDAAKLHMDVNGNAKVVEQYAPGYEDNTNGVAKVEHRYTPFRVTADGQVKAGAGFIHAISVNPTTATPTAGLLTIYDSLTETGTILHSEWVAATTPGHSILLDMTFATGLYVGYDATLANVSVDGTFR